jgi:hypothetical protein
MIFDRVPVQERLREMEDWIVKNEGKPAAALLFLFLYTFLQKARILEREQPYLVFLDISRAQWEDSLKLLIDFSVFKGTVQRKQRGVKLYISQFVLLRAVVASL